MYLFYVCRKLIGIYQYSGFQILYRPHRGARTLETAGLLCLSCNYIYQRVYKYNIYILLLYNIIYLLVL